MMNEDASIQVETPLLQRVLALLRERLGPDYFFERPGPLPWNGPVAGIEGLCTALITTGGLHDLGDPPFRALEEPLGDTGFRIIPHLVKKESLALDAPYVDQKYTPKDPEVALPMAALEAAHQAGKSGAPAKRHFSLCGGVVRPYPGLKQSSEAIASMLREDKVDAVVLLPTCSICIQTVCIVARELEARGFFTVALSLIPELSRIVGAPRTLAVKFPFGAPCGDPDNKALHQAILLEALKLLTELKEPGLIRTSMHSWRDAGL
ncbi:MAG: glycine/sarcosine/betaine reductase selenoprotein B family protein [Planctomycetota bacterium]